MLSICNKWPSCVYLFNDLNNIETGGQSVSIMLLWQPELHRIVLLLFTVSTSVKNIMMMMMTMKQLDFMHSFMLHKLIKNSNNHQR